jgi:hypothetical protein
MHSDFSMSRIFSLNGEGNHEYNITGAGSTFLTGNDKELTYGSDIIGDMVFAAITALDRADVIIESGFGWQDEGMANRLVNALNWDSSRKMVILHEASDMDNLLDPRKSYLCGFNDPDRHREQLVTSIDSYMSGTSWHEVKATISV